MNTRHFFPQICLPNEPDGQTFKKSQVAKHFKTGYLERDLRRTSTSEPVGDVEKGCGGLSITEISGFGTAAEHLDSHPVRMLSQGGTH